MTTFPTGDGYPNHKKKEGMKLQKEQFDITGMTCSACSARIEKSVGKLPGIKEVSVNLLKNSMVASYDESVLDVEGIVQAVEKAGYGAFPKKPAATSPSITTCAIITGTLFIELSAACALCSSSSLPPDVIDTSCIIMIEYEFAAKCASIDEYIEPVASTSSANTIPINNA